MSPDHAPKPPDRKELEETIGALQKVAKAQNMAKELKEKAAKAASPAERERLFKEAYEKEVEANGHSKMARRMQSGTWQGLFGGAGIGAGVSLGLGALVGTLVGGLLSIPTTALGGLIGAGTGAAHGPWIKVGDIQKRFEDASPAEVVDALEEEQRAGAEIPMERQSAKQQDNQRLDEVDAPKQRRKPRKLEIRSQKDIGQT
ncbi:hypothetical protein CERZMDRAFT_95065 [Cercospora zeae-maydis SCOH1-5]|uniref:Uncharacterized protein n=1 Tax=Cercospora zeae-maydis SCOH1-5 TaxID=717836 RepID=A0A6A6FMN4_9PEZI|nr:hypothetical protein CERZMDRAFT_95065 [Cercospora zeae-maydis SCOH1-5]